MYNAEKELGKLSDRVGRLATTARAHPVPESRGAATAAYIVASERLKRLELYATCPEPHPPPPVIDCEDCAGEGYSYEEFGEGPPSLEKVDCADCDGLGYLYDPTFHCQAEECFYCEEWPLGEPPCPDAVVPWFWASGPGMVRKDLERFQYLGSLAESEEDAPY